ncbi:hypothetical protein PVAND_015849 [Polypedilum vanderplanki]|uniref:Secreted protein n=1 Tax=Polypedilum vanderplanki TaxID=319348 RepID=A0A9J6BEE8_POLVA|nr:hypothetical protein PVAND_015849 [Polypedilum vanderplanki]
MGTKFLFVFFFSTIFIYGTKAGAPIIEDCESLQDITNNFFQQTRGTIFGCVRQGKNEIDNYVTANSNQSSKEFNDGIQKILDDTYKKMQAAAYKFFDGLVNNFPGITSKDAVVEYFIYGRPATYPLSCFGSKIVEYAIEKDFQLVKNYANEVIHSHQ